MFQLVLLHLHFIIISQHSQESNQMLKMWNWNSRSQQTHAIMIGAKGNRFASMLMGRTSKTRTKPTFSMGEHVLFIFKVGKLLICTILVTL